MSKASAELLASLMYAIPFTLLLVAIAFGAFHLGIPAPLASIAMIGIALGGAKLMVKRIRKTAERFYK
jgi:hypothetical protein